MNYNSVTMEYQKIINLLVNTPNQPSKFRTKKWIKLNDKARKTYNANIQIKFKTSMSSLCDCSDAYTCECDYNSPKHSSSSSSSSKQ